MKLFLVLPLCLFSLWIYGQTPAVADSSKYTLKCKLIEQAPFPAGCGIFALALVHKFEVLETNYPGYTQKYVLMIQPCPEFIGRAFFKAKHNYKIFAATNSGVAFDYIVVNKYKKEQLPIFWSREIELIK